MRDLVGKMEVGDCGEEGGEGGYFDGGEGSVGGRVSCIVREDGERGGGGGLLGEGLYSASNWLGRMRSAEWRRVL